MEGSVYTIAPRLIMPRSAVEMPAEITRRFWLTVRVPAEARPGVYRGRVAMALANGGPRELPLEFTVHTGTLDAVDVPAGPWGHTIDLPWDGPEAEAWNRDMAAKSLRETPRVRLHHGQRPAGDRLSRLPGRSARIRFHRSVISR